MTASDSKKQEARERITPKTTRRKCGAQAGGPRETEAEDGQEGRDIQFSGGCHCRESVYSADTFGVIAARKLVGDPQIRTWMLPLPAIIRYLIICLSPNGRSSMNY